MVAGSSISYIQFFVTFFIMEVPAMKRIFAIIMTSAMLMFLPAFVFAADKTVEMPDIKFKVNNQLEKLTDVPLGISGRTLLPLRATLVSLGVPNDDEHIKWNAKENSVTVINGGKTIYLKLGSKTAYINNIAFTLDAAPLKYARNQRVYIPVRFISNAVDKEVAWDGDTRSVLIRDRERYVEMKSILDKIDIAMTNIERVRLISKMKLNITKQASKMNLDVSMKEELDKKAGLLYSITEMPLFGGNISFSAFYKDNMEYIKDASGSKWEKTLLEESDFKTLLSEDVSLAAINNIEVMAFSLEKQKSPTKGEYLLKGSLYSKGFASNLGKCAGIRNLVPESYQLEAVIDEGTNLVKKLHAEFSGKADSGSSRSDVSAVIDAEYTDYNGTFEIKTPNDLLS